MPDVVSPDGLIPAAVLEQRLATAFGDADATRLAGLLGVQLIYAARNTTLQRERSRLAEKYGVQSPQVMEIDRRLAANRIETQNAAAESARAAVPTFQVSRDTAAIYGLVLAPGFKGLSGALVTALDPTGRPVGETETNATGYFNITIPLGQASRAPGLANLSGVPAGTTLRLNVTVDGKTVAEDAPGVQLLPGYAIYREVNVD